MSKHSSPGSPSPANTGSMKTCKRPTIDPVDLEESPTTTTTIRDDFVLMSTPDKFKDNPPLPGEEETDSIVQKKYIAESSHPQIRNLHYICVADTSIEEVPLHLKNLLQHFDNSSLDRGELLFLIIYALALESGFICKEDYEEHGDNIHGIPSFSSFHSKNILRLSRKPPKYIKSEDGSRFSMKLYSITDIEAKSTDEIFGLLVGFVTGDFLIVTFSPANSMCAMGFSLALSIGRYVLSMSSKKKPAFQRLRKLDELSILLRDKAYVPMRNQHLHWLGATIYPSLDGMPPELFHNVLQYLTHNQLQILANVSKTLYNNTVCSKYMLKYLQDASQPVTES